MPRFALKNASSAGAIAGFAIALVCTWKYLKTPSRQRNKVNKRDAPSSSSTSADTTAEGRSTSVSKSLTQPVQRGVVIRDSSPSTQLTLSQMVRRQLQGGRKMTCQLVGVILEETSSEELQKHAVVRPAVVDVLLEVARSCDLYLVARVLDDESEALVLSALDAVGVFTVGGLNRNKVLFCSTEAGRTSFVRQLEPDWHVDISSETISQLARFIRHQLHIAPAGAASIATNVFGAESLESYFGLPAASSV
ncbi:hypothetical protein R1sor_006835 [Riccia sorocarpa]|uniref:Peroxisome biogenesis protein 22 n=1 Tax=Riccia sorocarpa TaxID=122646 RepID=A0ABD3HV03_9MARC